MKRAVLAIIFVPALAEVAFAQDEGLSGDSGPRDNPQTQVWQLEAIDVTASKKTESLQDVPAAVTVLTDIELEDRKIDSVADIARYTPNFSNFSTGIMGLFTPNIRGKSGESSGSSVGLYVDGIPVLSGTGFDDVLVDIERVEVLRGPQGTLYGKNAQVGAVNIISTSPGNEFSGKVLTEGGTGNTYRASATLNIPIVEDVVQLRVSGLHSQHDGYLTYTESGREVDYRNYNYGKINLKVTPSDSFDINLIASAKFHDDGAVNMNLTDQAAEFFMLPKPTPDRVSSNREGWNKSHSDMQVLQLGWDVTSSLRLESITSRWMHRNHYLNDWDFSPFDIMHKEMDSTSLLYSQEVRALYTGESFDIMTGVYVDSGRKEFKEINDITGNVDEEHTTKTNSLGLFVNGDYDLTQEITLSAGLRYDWDRGEFDEPSRSRNITESWEEFSPRFSVSYAPTQQFMMYASVAKGYLAGGFNDHAAPSDPTSFDQESLWSYEAGVKARLLDNRLQINGALFHMDISDYQVRIDNPLDPSVNYTTNAAKAQSSGFEVEAQVKVSEMLTLSGGFGYTHAIFTDYTDANGDYTDKKLPYSSDYSGFLGATFRHPQGYFAGVNVSGYGKTYLNKENNYPRDPYMVVDTKIGYEADNVDFYIYADNLFDEDYSTDGYFGGMYRVASPPRRVGASLTYRF